VRRASLNVRLVNTPHKTKQKSVLRTLHTKKNTTKKAPLTTLTGKALFVLRTPPPKQTKQNKQNKTKQNKTKQNKTKLTKLNSF